MASNPLTRLMESDNVIKNARGFTLIELLIVIVVVAILTAIAYPSYTQFLIRSNRNVAKSDLVELQAWMERNYSLTNSYASLPDGTAVSIASLPFAKSPRDSGAAPRYVITFGAEPTATTYTLTATPQSNQPDNDCKILSITGANVRTASGPASASCWSN